MSHLFDGARVVDNQDGKHKTEAVLYSVVMSFVTIVNPCLATLFVDPACFQELLVPPAQIESSYTFEECEIFDDTRSCVEFRAYQIDTSFSPPFIYSNQCRNAVFSNYIPIVFITCAFNSVIWPVIYYLMVSRVTDLDSEIVLFYGMVHLKGKNLILGTKLYRRLHEIMEDLVLLLLFGTVFPLCAVALGISILSAVALLNFSIDKYLRLQSRTELDPSNLAVDGSSRSYSLETLAGVSNEYLAYLIWPGLAYSSLIYGFYLFDMALDSRDNGVAAPAVILALNVIVFLASAACFRWSRRRIRVDDAETASELRTVENPIVISEIDSISTPDHVLEMTESVSPTREV
jgi:hypothetical protein